jgi:hypothetical protein
MPRKRASSKHRPGIKHEHRGLLDGPIWFTETSAVAAHKIADAGGPDETYPFGL